MAKLALFIKEDSNAEYVVIVTIDEPRDYCGLGYKFYSVVDIGPDTLFAAFPCNTVLENTSVE